MENLSIYDKVRSVPEEAKKTIQGGNINGFTDINPMWRIKTLTEQFGICGVGWYTETLKQWTETGTDGRTAVFCNINLYIKVGGEWSRPIFGTGGSMFTDLAKGNPKSSDECFKMAYTDAISVACKQLGIGADVYWSKDGSKYDKPIESAFHCEVCQKEIKSYPDAKGVTVSAVKHAEGSKGKFGKVLCLDCIKAAADAN